MSFITKPKVAHPGLPRNELGLSLRDYEGGMSTLAYLSSELDSASRGRVTYCLPSDPSEELVATACGR